MLNFIYWPISAVLWFWHWLLSLVMNPAWGNYLDSGHCAADLDA